MPEETFDLWLVQSPDHPGSGRSKEDMVGQLENLLQHFFVGLPVNDIQDFITKVIMESMRRGKKVKNLIIAAHGACPSPGSGGFYIGKNWIGHDEKTYGKEINSLQVLRRFLAKDANVYILACHTGGDRILLGKISAALGGVKVHGYTGSIVTTSYWLWVTLNAEGKHVVCLRNKCDYSEEGVPEPSWQEKFAHRQPLKH